MPLVLVGTPIGNLGDLSPRAAEELARAEVVCCEDTRRTGRLLELAGIARRPLLVVNDHTEAAEVPGVLARLERGERVAVVSDAGMPGVSDPGERLVAAALDAGHAVEVVPGPSAAVTALVASGLPAARWAFEGFLPRKGPARAERLVEIAAERRATVLYEAPHRLARTLADLVEACGPDRRVAIARELTKLHEQRWRGTLGEALRAAEALAKGELVLVLEGAPPPAGASEADVDAAVAQRLAAGESARDAAAGAAAALGVPKRQAYDAALRQRRA